MRLMYVGLSYVSYELAVKNMINVKKYYVI